MSATETGILDRSPSMTRSNAPNAFRPNPLLSPQLLQTVLGSKRPVKRIWQKRGNRMDEFSTWHVLDTGDGVRLTGMHSMQPPGTAARGLAVLIHGWEGSHESAYQYSMAAMLFAERWNVFRLNLRDHAGSHALNEAMFHSARMDEVFGAIKAIRTIDGNDKLVVVGFSLGGNFALRVGMQGPAAGLNPLLSIGISPSIDPGATLRAIDGGPRVFRRYFLDKWRKTLQLKAEAWPGRFDFSGHATIDTFVEITRHFVSKETGFDSLDAYLATYTLTPTMMMNSASPLAIITARDDTVIPIADFDGLEARGSVVSYDAPLHGGHCGFIENFALDSWGERRVLSLLQDL